MSQHGDNFEIDKNKSNDLKITIKKTTTTESMSDDVNISFLLQKIENLERENERLKNLYESNDNKKKRKVPTKESKINSESENPFEILADITDNDNECVNDNDNEKNNNNNINNNVASHMSDFIEVVKKKNNERKQNIKKKQ
jgi:hypothetical protein